MNQIYDNDRPVNAYANTHLQRPSCIYSMWVYLILLYDSGSFIFFSMKKTGKALNLTYKSITRYMIISCQSLISLITL